MNKKLLTISIPTWNRAEFLKVALEELRSQLDGPLSDFVNVLVSDNCSTDNTAKIIDQFMSSGLDIQYIRNESNLGWGRNFQQCISEAETDHVLLLSDDDVLVDDSISRVIDLIQKHKDVGVICLKPYGFDNDFDIERPNRRNRETIETWVDAGKFLERISLEFTLLSCCVINTSRIGKTKYIELSETSNFLHLFYILDSLFSHTENIYIDEYLVASKRNNSVNYEFSEIFVREFWSILDSFRTKGLTPEVRQRVQDKLLITYYPFYFQDVRKNFKKDVLICIENCDKTFGSNKYYKFWAKPILIWPSFIAQIWGLFVILIGRIKGGEFEKLVWKIRLKLRIR